MHCLEISLNKNQTKVSGISICFQKRKMLIDTLAEETQRKE